MTTYISIAAVADGTIIYYDQWENGYDGDIANPANLYSGGNPGGTQIWVTAIPNGGARRALSSDLIDAGTVILNNNVTHDETWSAIDFDGRDKIAATKTGRRDAHPVGHGIGHPARRSVGVFDQQLGHGLPLPVGASIPDADDHQMFEYLARHPGRRGAAPPVQIDKDNGSFETTVTLAEGEPTRERRRQRRRASRVRPVQGRHPHRRHRLQHESRDSGLLPTNLWSTSSYTGLTVSTAQSISEPPPRCGSATPAPRRGHLVHHAQRRRRISPRR